MLWRAPSQAESFELISLIFFYTEAAMSSTTKTPDASSCAPSNFSLLGFHAAHIQLYICASASRSCFARAHFHLGNQTKLPKFAANEIMRLTRFASLERAPQSKFFIASAAPKFKIIYY